MNPKFEFSIITSNSNRSRAYLAALKSKGFYPKMILHLETRNIGNGNLPHQVGTVNEKTSNKFIKRYDPAGFSYDEKQRIQDWASNNSIPLNEIRSENPNAPESIQAIKDLPTSWIIYAGPGGIILKENLFEIGKRYLHVHPGKLPEYKGSTTYYYQLLREREMWASLIEMVPALDSGQVIWSKQYPLPKNGMLDLDHHLDPSIRAHALVDGLEHFISKQFTPASPESSDGDTYYIIHPVLKHLAWEVITKLKQ